MRSLRVLMLLPAGAAMAFAQSGTGQTVQLTFTVTATYSYSVAPSNPGIPNGTIINYTGTSAPFGPCDLVAIVGVKSFQLTTSSGSLTLNVSSDTIDSSVGGTLTETVQLAVAGGTGIFTSATGNVTIDAVSVGNYDINTETTTNNDTFTGSGTLVLAGGAGVTISPSSLQLQGPQGSAVSATVALNNQGGTSVSYAGSVASDTSWLSVISAPGTLVPGGAGTIQVSANPAGLALGVYQGQLEVAIGNGSTTVPVTFVVGTQGAQLQLSQTGLTFQATALGPSPATQSFGVFNRGIGTLSGLTVTTSVTGSEPNWLTATVASGFASATNAAVTVSVNPGTLKPGTYYGQITLNMPSAFNTPQTVSVQMVVATAVPTFQPAGVDMAVPFDSNLGPEGELTGPLPSPINVVVTNPTPAALSFTVTLWPGLGYGPSSEPYQPYFNFPVQSGTIPAGGTVSLPLSVNSGCFSDVDCLYYVQTIWNWEVWDISFPAINYSYLLWTVLLVTGSSSAPQIPSWGAPPPGATVPAFVPARKSTGVHPLASTASTCTPSVLEGLITSEPPSGFQATVGQPVPLTVTSFDNCGNNLDSGQVWASFSDNDTPVPLIPLGGGQWSATWVPSQASSSTTMTVQGVSPSGLYGSGAIPVSVAASTTTPIVTPGSVVNAASNAPVIAPGAFIAIYGENFPSTTTIESTPTYPTSLASTQVFLGGEALPLYFVAGNQIDALVPFDATINSTQSLVVQTGNALSAPVQVAVGEASPGVFTQNQSGSGPGAILSYPAGGTPALNTPSNPASAGYVLEIYCTGLGPVSPAVAAGTPASPTTLSYTTNTVTATVGGQNAQVLFAGLAPGYVGLYQVDLLVPSGLASSNSTPLVLNVAGASSAPVTVAIK